MSFAGMLPQQRSLYQDLVADGRQAHSQSDAEPELRLTRPSGCFVDKGWNAILCDPRRFPVAVVERAPAVCKQGISFILSSVTVSLKQSSATNPSCAAANEPAGTPTRMRNQLTESLLRG